MLWCSSDLEKTDQRKNRYFGNRLQVTILLHPENFIWVASSLIYSLVHFLNQIEVPFLFSFYVDRENHWDKFRSKIITINKYERNHFQLRRKWRKRQASSSSTLVSTLRNLDLNFKFMLSCKILHYASETIGINFMAASKSIIILHEKEIRDRQTAKKISKVHMTGRFLYRLMYQTWWGWIKTHPQHEWLML